MYVITEIEPVEGEVTLTELDAEVEVFSVSDDRVMVVTGYIDLSEMQTGDTVVLREYIAIEPYGIPKGFNTVSYSDVQADPIVCFPLKVIRGAYRLTIKQTAGAPRSFKYQFFKFVVEPV